MEHTTTIALNSRANQAERVFGTEVVPILSVQTPYFVLLTVGVHRIAFGPVVVFQRTPKHQGTSYQVHACTSEPNEINMMFLR